MGGPNLEIFKFGMYIMFPIGWMYYFGTNLDNKFSVKDFWPTKEQLNKIPTEREDIQKELEKMKKRRLMRRELRLQEEAVEEDKEAIRTPVTRGLAVGEPLDQMGSNVASAVPAEGKGWLKWAGWR